MRRGHLELLRPVCPVCRGQGDAPLRLAQVAREENGHVIEGVLHCSRRECQREYPIIDGIPIIVVEIRRYISDQLAALSVRQDWSELTESLIGDGCEPNSIFNQTRQYLSSYTWDHYADLDPAEARGEPAPGAMARTLATGWTLLPPVPTGPALEAGCSVGRGTFELAARRSGLVLGVDLNFAMLRVAAQALRTGIVRYPRRRSGLVYERREFAVNFAGAERVDFWACDATALPFADATFAFVAGFNVLDCVNAPREFLAAAARVLGAGGQFLGGCPYDWSASVTPVEAWLGGHSQRAPGGGASAELVRALLTPGAHPQSIDGLRLVAERDDLPWHVRLHDRSTMLYRLHLVAAAKS